MLGQIFASILIPRGVEQELSDPSAPETVRQWIAKPPAWLETRALVRPPEPELARRLDRGEAEAIQLALELHSDFLLIDERRGRQMAATLGLTVIGALGTLLESYRWGLIQNPLEILTQLRASGFRLSRQLVEEFDEQIRLLAPRK